MISTLLITAVRSGTPSTIIINRGAKGDTGADGPPGPGDTLTAAEIAAAYDAETALATTPEIQTGTETATRRINPAVLNAAITAIAQGLVNALVNAAPGALDTLDELAAALGDDANFAATITTALAGKYGAGDSPTFLGITVNNCTVDGWGFRKQNWTWVGDDFYLADSRSVLWSVSNFASSGGYDTGISKNAAGVVEINNGTPGTFRDITLRNVTASGDIEASTIAKGVILKSPDGTRYRATMANGGTLAIAAV